MQVNAANGLKSLMIGAHAKHFVGWGEGKGRLFLEDLLARTITPEIIYRHEWQNHGVVIRDNQAIVHRATPYDTVNYRRLMRRIALRAGHRHILLNCLNLSFKLILSF